MRLNDAVTGGVLLVLAALLAFWSQRFPAIPGQQYGAALFPTLVAAGLGGCGLVLIVSGIRQGGPALAWADWARERHGLRNVLITTAAVVFYIVASDRLGFILTIIPILLLTLRMLAVGWVASLVIAVLVALLIQYLFGDLLYVPLPWGLLSSIRW